MRRIRGRDGGAVRLSDARLGNARTAALPGGGLIGVRAPLHASEEPVVRPYWLVDDIEAALAAALEAGGIVAHPPMEIAGHGTFAIYIDVACTTVSGSCRRATANPSVGQ